MTRGLMTAPDEALREALEGDLAGLGNARVFLRLVGERLKVANRMETTGLLGPALDDLAQAERLIVSVQGRLKARCPDPRNSR